MLNIVIVFSIYLKRVLKCNLPTNLEGLLFIIQCSTSTRNVSRFVFVLCFSLVGYSFEKAKILVENRAQVDAPDAVGFTPLKLAIDNGSQECAFILLDAGADPEKASVNDSVVPEWVTSYRPNSVSPCVCVCVFFWHPPTQRFLFIFLARFCRQCDNNNNNSNKKKNNFSGGPPCCSSQERKRTRVASAFKGRAR